MNYWLLTGTEPPPFEAWQLFYALALIISSLMLMTGLVFTLRIDRRNFHEYPMWFIIPAGLGLIIWIGFPYNVVVAQTLIMSITALGAPSSATAIAGAFIVSSWLITTYSFASTYIPKSTS